MDPKEFLAHRKNIAKTQRQMAALLGTSLKAVHSYEQGWRRIPTHVERQLLFLIVQRNSRTGESKPCWEQRACPADQREQCPAWEFQTGQFCWFINGTICHGTVQKSWEKKMVLCRQCEVLMALLYPPEPEKGNMLRF